MNPAAPGVEQQRRERHGIVIRVHGLVEHVVQFDKPCGERFRVQRDAASSICVVSLAMSSAARILARNIADASEEEVRLRRVEK
jgi:hypothetical protein